MLTYLRGLFGMRKVGKARRLIDFGEPRMKLIQSLALSGLSLPKTLAAAAAIAILGLVSAAPASAGPITITGSYTTAITLDGTTDQVNTESQIASSNPVVVLLIPGPEVTSTTPMRPVLRA